MKCLIAGASGLVGQHLLTQLISDSNVESITTLARKSLTEEHAKLNFILTSFEQLENLTLPSVDVAFCCLGTTIKKAGSEDAFYKVDHDYIINYANACHRAGIKTFIVVSAVGADSSSSIFYNRVKGKTEDDLVKINFTNLFVLRPSLLMGDRSEHRPGEKLAQTLTHLFGSLMVGPLRKIRPVDASAVAKKMKACAIESQSHVVGNKIVMNQEI